VVEARRLTRTFDKAATKNLACQQTSSPTSLPLFSTQAFNASIMAPIRRYLRITKYSVLECRIYVDNPALAESWLLNPRNPVLPRVIESVRPLVLPKLREENERAKGKGGKKKGVKDVVVEGMPVFRSWRMIANIRRGFRGFYLLD
jgi:hypothetical protein